MLRGASEKNTGSQPNGSEVYQKCRISTICHGHSTEYPYNANIRMATLTSNL